MVAAELKRRVGKLRAMVFPIENAELKKFFMMSGMMFFIIYVYTVRYRSALLMGDVDMCAWASSMHTTTDQPASQFSTPQVVRDTKDTLIVSSCGAEAITFLKVRWKGRAMKMEFIPTSGRWTNQRASLMPGRSPFITLPHRCTACCRPRRSS